MALDVIAFILWFFVGITDLLKRKINKWDYGIVWLVLMLNLLKNILVGL